MPSHSIKKFAYVLSKANSKKIATRVSIRGSSPANLRSLVAPLIEKGPFFRDGRRGWDETRNVRKVICEIYLSHLSRVFRFV